MSTTLPYLLTDSLLTVMIKGVPHNFNEGTDQYTKVVDFIKSPDNQDKNIESLLDVVAKVQEFVKDSTILQVRGSDLYAGEERITGPFANRVLKMIEQGFDASPMSNFHTKLQLNPSFRVWKQLYAFMEYGKLPITPDGDFLAYKRVKHATIDGKVCLVDCHSGKIVNDVGTHVKMDRRKVDDEPDNTCSYGLHACSHEYLQNFSGTATITVQINPADVVSIPTDYNNTKLRCCAYTVLEILPDSVRSFDHLSSSSVMSSFTGREDDDRDHDDDEDEDDRDDDHRDTNQYTFPNEEFVHPDNQELHNSVPTAIVPKRSPEATQAAPVIPSQGGTPARWEVHIGYRVSHRGVWIKHADWSRFSSRDAARSELYTDSLDSHLDGLYEEANDQDVADDQEKFFSARVFDAANGRYI